MRNRLFLLAALLCIPLFLTGCGAAEKAANEGTKALDSGMRSKEKAKEYASKKETFDAQAEEF